MDIAREIEVGEIYDGTVTRIMNFGAFVDIGGGKEGLLHISKYLVKEWKGRRCIKCWRRSNSKSNRNR